MEHALSLALKNHPKNHLNSICYSKEVREAAVLVLFHELAGEPSLVLTKRSEEVLHHKGQICFPGGVCDEGDGSLWETALRETEEEIGIKRDSIRYLGELGKITTPTGFQVTPFVGFLTGPAEYLPNPDEITEIFSVPVSHLLDLKNLKLVPRSHEGHNYHDAVFHFKTHEIWGATGRIIVEFLEAWKSIR
ncbi:MAG: CoA pyrophosphatase [Deltaproteobacteria bacterium]|nr:CoA pyrophosphatase [Deltaproteobacteria bacterium]